MLQTSLWIAQGLLALVFALAGAVKLAVPREKLAERMHWAAEWPRWRIRLLGLAELTGAVGLVVPAVTGIAPLLTALAALCLAALMVGALRTHQRLGEPVAPALAIGVLCAGVAAGRLFIGPRP